MMADTMTTPDDPIRVFAAHSREIATFYVAIPQGPRGKGGGHFTLLPETL